MPKLEHIAYNDFPTPRIPVPDFVPSSQKEESTTPKRGPALTKEPSVERASIPEEAALEGSEREDRDDERNIPKKAESPRAKREQFSKSPLPNTIAPPAHTLPPPLLSLLQTIQSTLSSSFPDTPPHTVQRLAELLLHPRKHYRTLPSYLRALDRIVSVASPSSIFPLPDLTVSDSTFYNNGNGRNSMLNGISSPAPDSPIRDRDFIGGAELTEIPWLRNNNSSATPPSTHANTSTTSTPTSDLRTESTAVIDGPNGAGSVETVTVNVNGVSSANHQAPQGGEDNGANGTSHGITQGELLRQEQEAGIVPVPSSPSTSANSRITRSNSAAATAAAERAVGLEPSVPVAEESGEGGTEVIGEGEDVEPVHARGPGIIGMEDMGPQAPGSGLEGGLDLEGALGRRGEGQGVGGSDSGATGGEDRRVDGGSEGRNRDVDGDGDVVIADADGVVEGEEGVDARGGEKGVDAVDGSSL
ncbi:hypothetical protein ACLMJK_008308 [Lecanora helva]